jgi:Ca2+/Na+ antiporter
MGLSVVALIAGLTIVAVGTSLPELASSVIYTAWLTLTVLKLQA